MGCSRKNLRKSNLRKSRGGGFSLLELLAVVAVFALLVGLGLPALSKARGKARDAACAAELRGLGERVTLYAMDSRDFVPFLYRHDRQTGRWTAPNGVAVPEGYLERAGDFWVYPMLDEFGGQLTHDALLCPNDRVAPMQVEHVAQEMGVLPSDVRLPMTRTVSRSFYRSIASLRRDGLGDLADPFERVAKLSDAAFPSSKALLVEDPPFHDQFEVGELFNISAELPFRRMVAGVDLAGSLRSIRHSPRPVLPTIDVYSDYPGSVEEYLDAQRLLAAFHYTRDGVRGRDW